MHHFAFGHFCLFVLCPSVPPFLMQGKGHRGFWFDPSLHGILGDSLTEALAVLPVEGKSVIPLLWSL